MITSIFHHYTSIPSFMSIIKSGEGWATDSRFLNDETEFEYGIELVQEALQGQMTDDPARERLLGIISDAVYEVSDSRRVPFVFCMSSKKDDLNQWRSYSDDAGRLSIGFDRDAFTQKSIPMNTQYGVTGVIYHRTSCLKALGATLYHMIPRVESAFKSGSNFETEVELIAMSLRQSAILMKHESFAEEDESRLTIELFQKSATKVHFRAGKYGITPYVVWNYDKSMIKEVVIGPSPHTNLQRMAVEEFLNANGVTATVSISEIPYRV